MPAFIETELPASPAETVASVPQRPNLVSAILYSELARLAGTIALYSFAALLFIRAFYIADPDIWWHLRTGQWILEHHAVPLTDLFSLYGADKPWIAYSWLFDTAMAALFSRWGLAAIAL